jgi:parallel beta-helix repeat protein
MNRILSILALLLCLPLSPSAPAATENPAASGGDGADAPAGCTATAAPGDDLQKAIDDAAAASPAARLCLSGGEFRLNGYLSIRHDGFTLRGDGDRTVLRLTAGTESPVLVIGDALHADPDRPVSHVTVERLRVIGGGHDGREFDPALPYLMNSAVAVRDGHDVRISDLEVDQCRSACILTERGSRDVVIAHNTAEHAAFDGLSLNDTTAAHIVDNTLRDNKAAGLTAEHLQDSVVTGNRFVDNGSEGMYLSNSYGNRFVGNRLDDNRTAGVFLTCAVIQHSFPLRCAADSMSHDNVFERNTFAGNGHGFFVAPNPAADCTARDFARNRSQRDVFGRDDNRLPDASAFGQCLDIEGANGAA